jgi:hypothetical protein
MGTRAHIGFEHDDGTVDVVYLHWDGYPAHAGRLLVKHYHSKEKAKELVSMGSISELDENIHPPANVRHTPEMPARDTCIFYKRDRKERQIVSTQYKSVDDAVMKIKDMDVSYLYIFIQNQWQFWCFDKNNKFGITVDNKKTPVPIPCYIAVERHDAELNREKLRLNEEEFKRKKEERARKAREYRKRKKEQKLKENAKEWQTLAYMMGRNNNTNEKKGAKT